MTKTEKTTIRNYINDRYSDRNPRNIRIRKNGAVEARMVSELGWQHGDDQVFCGWDTDILEDARRDAAYAAERMLPSF